MDAVAITVTDLRAAAGKSTRALAHRLDVAAGREGRSGAGEDGAADVAVFVDAFAGLGKELAVAFLAQRIAAFGPVDGERDDVPGLLEQERCHVSLLGGRVAEMGEPPQMMVGRAEQRVDDRQALEVVTD